MPVHLTRLAPLWLLLAACAGGDEGTPSDTGPTIPDYDPEVELGTGETAFEPLADGETAFVVFGPQGGYHITGALLARGVDPGNPEDLADARNPLTTFQILVDGTPVSGLLGDEVVDYKQGLEDVPGDPGVFQLVNRRVFLDITSDDELDGVEIVMSVEVEDADGVVVRDERTLIARPHPLND